MRKILPEAKDEKQDQPVSKNKLPDEIRSNMPITGPTIYAFTEEWERMVQAEAAAELIKIKRELKRKI